MVIRNTNLTIQMIASNNGFVEVCRIYLSKFNLKKTTENLINELKSHPNYPSLYALADICDLNQIEYKTLSIDINGLSNLNYVNSLIHILGTRFVIFEKVSDKNVYYITDENLRRQEPLAEFMAKCDGTVFIIQAKRRNLINFYLTKLYSRTNDEAINDPINGAISDTIDEAKTGPVNAHLSVCPAHRVLPHPTMCLYIFL